MPFYDGRQGCNGGQTLPSPEHVHPLKLFDIAKSEGRPLYVSAPMVRYSKLAFRQTVYEYGTDLCWTPMILAKEFNRNAFARDSDFTLSPTPVPTIVQLGASSPEEFSRAALLVAPHVSGIDLNCGCPQSWACAESLGAALMNDREKVSSIVAQAKATLGANGLASSTTTTTTTSSPDSRTHTGKTVSVKIRVHKDLRQTVDFVQAVQAAGVDFITIHGRTKNTRSSVPVNLEAIALVASHCSVPVIANGDVVSLTRARAIADRTGVQGVMSSRAILANPALFAGFDTCPWEAVEKFMNFVVKAPLPFALVLHHLAEMVSDGGFGGEGVGSGSGALVSRKERAEMLACTDMLELVDWLDAARGIRRSM